MIGFENTFLSTEEILNKIEYISNGDIGSILLIILVIFISIVFINYIFPILHIVKTHVLKEREKSRKRKMIQQIAIQREVEKKIEKELHIKSNL